jgi:hypothetical protein
MLKLINKNDIFKPTTKYWIAECKQKHHKWTKILYSESDMQKYKKYCDAKNIVYHIIHVEY